MKIAIITDGNNVLGMGHVYQSVTLAGELSKKIDSKCMIFFLTKSDQVVTDRLSETGFEVFRYPSDDAILQALVREAPDRVIFDKLDVPPNLARQIKQSLNCKLIIFTNLTAANKYANMTVLAGMGRNFKNVREIDAVSGVVHYFGPKYWILRPEFFMYAKIPKEPLKQVKKIMLMFGGVDQLNLTCTVLDELLRINGGGFAILVVVGRAYTYHKELNKIVERSRMDRSDVQLVHDLKDVAKAMHQADVVFTSPGLSYYEALTVGTPVVGFHQNDMQRDVHSEHLVTLDKSESSRIASIINNRSFIFPEDPLIASMEIGRGKDEIIQAILS